jgi:hypothetical protein
MEIFTRFRCLTIMYATGNDDDNLVLGKSLRRCNLQGDNSWTELHQSHV